MDSVLQNTRCIGWKNFELLRNTGTKPCVVGSRDFLRLNSSENALDHPCETYEVI